MMVKPVKKRAIQEWKMTEAEQPKEKVPEPMPKALVNHVEKVARSPTVAGILSPQAVNVMHPSHPFHLPPHGMLPDPHHNAVQAAGAAAHAAGAVAAAAANIRNHYNMESVYIRPPQAGISRRLSPGPPNVLIRPQEMHGASHHPGLLTATTGPDMSGLPGRGAKRPQVPQDMAAVDAKTARKRRKPEGTTELVMSPFVNGSVNGSVHINEKVPPIQPIILDFEVPLPPISPTMNSSEERQMKPDASRPLGSPHASQSMSPAHSPASMRDEEGRSHQSPAENRHPPRSPGEQSEKRNLFKKPDIDHYKSSVQTGGTRCFICQNAIFPNQKDYPVAPSGLVICTKCRKVALSGSPVAIGPPPKIHLPKQSSQSRSQPQQRIPRSPVAKSPAASLTLPRSPLPKSPMSRSPAPSSPLGPHSAPSSPANTLSAPNSPASTSGLSVPGSPRPSAPSSPRAPNSPRHSAPSSPVPRPQGSPVPRNNSGSLLAVSRSPYLMSGSVSQPPSPRPMEMGGGRRHSISGTHLDVPVGSGAPRVSPTGAATSPRSDSAALMENIQLPPGREGDDATIRALLQLGRMRAADQEHRLHPGADGRTIDRGDLKLPVSLADIGKLDRAQLLELQHKLMYADLPSRVTGALSSHPAHNGDIVSKFSKSQVSHSSGIPPLSKNSGSANSSQNNVLKLGNPPQLVRSEGVVGSALPITALSSTTEDAPLKISRVIRSAQEQSERKRSHSPSDVRSRLHESLEALSKEGNRCMGSRLLKESRQDKSGKYFGRDSTTDGSQIDMYREQYAVFQCHCSGSEMFFIKCPDCDFICNSIFGMELHIAAQRHAESRVPGPRQVDYGSCEEPSGKDSIADSDASHSSFETQSADTELDGSASGSPQRTSQEPSSTVYSPVSGGASESWREQPTSRIKTSSGVVDLGSTVPHVNIPRYLSLAGSDSGPYHVRPDHPSPLDLSGKRSAAQMRLEHSHSHERRSSKERRPGSETTTTNSPLDLSGYKTIQTPNSQFVSSQRLGSVGSMIEKSVASSMPSLTLPGGGPGIPNSLPSVPGMVITGAPPAISSHNQPYPIPTMFAVQPSSVAGLYPLSTLAAGNVPLLAPVKIQSPTSAPPSPNYSKNSETTSYYPRRASSYSLAPPLGRSPKSVSPTLSSSVLSLSPRPQDPSRHASVVAESSHKCHVSTIVSSSHQSTHPLTTASSGNKFLSYQGGTIAIHPSTNLATSSVTHQKTVTLESQYTTVASTPSSVTSRALSPQQTPMPSSPAPHLSSTVQLGEIRIKEEPHSPEAEDQEQRWTSASKQKETGRDVHRESQQEMVNEGSEDSGKLSGSDNSLDKGGKDKEKEKEKEKTKTPPPKSQTPVVSSPSQVQIKVEAET